MPRLPQEGLTLRENQIMEVIWQQGEATVEEVQKRLSDDLSNSTVRALLNIMRRKGYVECYKQSKAKIYRALIPRREAQASAVQQLIQRLFQGSAEQLILRLVEDDEISMDELERLQAQVRGAGSR